MTFPERFELTEKVPLFDFEFFLVQRQRRNKNIERIRKPANKLLRFVNAEIYFVEANDLAWLGRCVWREHFLAAPACQSFGTPIVVAVVVVRAEEWGTWKRRADYFLELFMPGKRPDFRNSFGFWLYLVKRCPEFVYLNVLRWYFNEPIRSKQMIHLKYFFTLNIFSKIDLFKSANFTAVFTATNLPNLHTLKYPPIF